MKMKNKILGILIALVVMIGVMACQVNAADMSASSTEVKVGDTVTVTLKLDKPTQSIGLDLKYDANSFEYQSVSSDLGDVTVNANNPGTVKIAGSHATNSATYVTFTFVAKANTDAADFVGSRFFSHEDETLNTSTVTVAVAEPTVEPEPEQPDVEVPDENQPSDVTDTVGGADTDTNVKVDDEGKVITKLPQTGTSIITVAGIVVAVVVAGAIAVRKLRK